MILVDADLRPERRLRQSADRRLGVGQQIRALEADLERRLGQGIAAVKCGLAYQRSLRFDKVSERETTTVEALISPECLMVGRTLEFIAIY